MTTIGSDDFSALVGEELSGVTFVRDYLQLQFNPPPLLNVYTPVTIRCGERNATFGEEAFANLLIAQINKIVNAVDFRPQEALEIRFEDGSTLAVSLRPEHYVGAEAINLFLKDEAMVVI